MAYSVLADIQNEFKNTTFTTTSAPTSTVITSTFIPQADAEIDSIVGLRYSTPITGTNALLRMKQLSTWLVTARVRETLRVKTGDSIPQQGARDGDLRKMALDALDKISKGTSLLSDATLANAVEGLASYATKIDTSEALFFNKNSDQY